MADYQGVSFSMKTSGNTDTNADVVAFDSCSVFSLPDATVMLKSHRSGMRVLVPADIFGLMQHCVHYKTITDHLDYLVKLDPTIAEHRGQLHQVMEDLSAQGLMSSGQRLISELTLKSGSAIDIAAFSGTYIRTCDRPAQLKRLLDSLSQHQKTFGHQHRYIVVDDSRDIGNQQHNQTMCDDYESNGELLIEYYGVQEQADFQNKLALEFPDNAQTIHWLLARPDDLVEGVFTGGRLLNHIILLAAGKRFALFDDDAVCQPYQSPQMQHRWNFKAQPKDVWFYQDREQLFAEIKPVDIDPLTRHLDVLGKSLGQVVDALSAVELSSDSLEGVTSDNSQNFRPDTSILITRNGTFGDPGTSSMAWIYQQEGKALERLTEDHQAFKRYSSNRTTWLGSHTFRAINENALMTTTLTGIDGSQLIPPTGPSYRNEDYLFSRLLKFIHPSSVSFEFPWGLPHLPEPSRQWHAAKLDDPKTVGILGFLADIANNVERFCMAKSPQQRLRYVGETYRTLADAKHEALKDGIEENLLNARASEINRMQVLLGEHSDQPQYWVDDVKRILNANQHGLAQPEQNVFPDAGAGETSREQVQSCQAVLSTFGEGLMLWPLLWEHCKSNN
jgi:hypothetical protein